MINPSDMVLFAAVVRDGSFTKAAAHLGVTKQSVSERLAKLEEKLGVRLLERTTRRLRVTDAGGRYVERCQAIAAQIEEANREVQQQQVEPTGVLRVSAPRLYGRRFLGPVVSAFLGRYPKTRVELVLGDHRVHLIDDGFDLAIRMGALDDSTLAARKLGEGHVYLVASPRFLARAGNVTARSLPGLRTIGLKASETWSVRGDEVKVEPVLVVNDLELACEAAVAGAGVAQVPSIVCAEAVREKKLKLLLGAEPMMTRPVHVVFPSRKFLAARVRAFIDLLAERVEPMRPL